jgi:hypothetical protein
MLSWNKRKVQNLSPGEVWLFIVARVVVGFGLGVLAMRYFPATFGPLGIPAVVIGVILFAIAAKGLFRETKLN